MLSIITYLQKSSTTLARETRRNEQKTPVKYSYWKWKIQAWAIFFFYSKIHVRKPVKKRLWKIVFKMFLKKKTDSISFYAFNNEWMAKNCKFQCAALEPGEKNDNGNA